MVWLALFHARSVYITVAGWAVVDRPAVTGLRRLENLQIHFLPQQYRKTLHADS